MPRWLTIAVGLVLILVLTSLAVWFLVHRIRRSEDPAKIVVKLIASAIILVLCGFALFKGVGLSLGGAFIVPFVAVILGLIGSLLWAPHIGAVLAKPITSAFDGGNEEVIPQPLYSVAIARRKNGKYQEAIYHILQQLEKFPTDAAGQFLLAEIQAENLNDLQAAELTIERLCSQPGHAPESIAVALNTLADWHLKYAQDPDAARQDLEKLAALLPDSQFAQLAHQRIAHLAGKENFGQAQDRSAIPLVAGVQNVGLMKDSSVLRKPDKDPAGEAAEYVKHLEQFPLDTDAREKLALIYAQHYQRPDLGIEQLEQLIQAPHQPARQVVHWLNLVADLQIQAGRDYETIKQTLERIIDLYPARAYAENARQRLEHVKLSLKAREKSQTLPLGSYEQNIGLKQKPGPP